MDNPIDSSSQNFLSEKKIDNSDLILLEQLDKPNEGSLTNSLANPDDNKRLKDSSNIKVVDFGKIDNEVNIETAYKKTRISFKFLLSCVSISYMFAILCFYKNNKKAIGINDFDDSTLTNLAIPTGTVIFIARVFGGH